MEHLFILFYVFMCISLFLHLFYRFRFYTNVCSFFLFVLFLGIHRLKQSMPKRKAGKMAKSYDPIAPVAEEISEEACLLCFDEFQVMIFSVSTTTVPAVTVRIFLAV